MHSPVEVSPVRSPRRVQRVETVVVGGGQAGLAVGQRLMARDLDFLILDAEQRVGDTWRRRWDSLRLFTPARYSALPGMVFPAPPDHYPDKDEVADYLARYAERFDLPVSHASRVESLGWNGERFVLRAGDRSVEADNVVVATGPFQRPRVPVIAARLDPSIHQLHSSDYRTPFTLPDGPVLVVGAGNSGAQIALELSRFRKVWLAGRDAGYVPRRLLGRDVFDWIWPLATHATVETKLGRRLRRRMQGGDARIGISNRLLTDAGIVRAPRLTGERGGLPVCEGEVLAPRVVIWCTGFEPDFGWIDLPVTDERGFPRQTRGGAAGWPGLHFVGLRFQHRLTSSLLGGVGADAEFTAALVARRCEVGAAA